MTKTFDELVLPNSPYRGYYVNNAGGAASIDDLTLISHIKDGLYVGGCVKGVDLKDFFSHVFSMYKWEQYKVSPKTKVHTVIMYDTAAKPVDVEAVDDVANRVVTALAEGGNVLVHCQAGINRSNLVAATALVKMGMTPSDAIGLLREKRSRLVLSNKLFEDFLLTRK